MHFESRTPGIGPIIIGEYTHDTQLRITIRPGDEATLACGDDWAFVVIEQVIDDGRRFIGRVSGFLKSPLDAVGDLRLGATIEFEEQQVIGCSVGAG